MRANMWIGTDGDWNDPSNWQNGTVPQTSDIAVFQDGNATIEGSAYVGNISLDVSNLTISGVFSSTTSNSGLLSDGPEPSGASTLAIDPWGSLEIGTLDLACSSLVDQGLLITDVADIQTGFVTGASAEWFSTTTSIEGSLSVFGGGLLEGNFALQAGACLITDGYSEVTGGTLSVIGDSTIDFTGPGDESSSQSLAIGDDISLGLGTNLNIISPTGSPVVIQGNIYGQGTITLVGASLVVGGVATSATSESQELKAFSSQSAVTQAASSDFSLTSSVLDLTSQDVSNNQPEDILCSGDADAIYAGGQSVSVTSAAARLIDFHGGSGSNTVNAGSSILSYVQGQGAGFITCGTSGQDTVQVGAGSSTVVASQGASIEIIGAGNSSIVGSAGSYLVDDRDGSGETAIYAGDNQVSDTILAGSGSLTVQGASGTLLVEGGTGNLTVWGGTSGDDTIIGGTGRNTLVGGIGALVIGNGTIGSVYGLNASAATVNATASSGNDTIFATGGPGVSRLLCGSGNDVFLGGLATLDATCGSGDDTIWGANGVSDTLIGGTGSDVLQGGPAATIVANGHGSNVVISGGDGTTIDCRNSVGQMVVFALQQGMTSIQTAAASLIAVTGSDTLNIVAGQADVTVWCESNSLVDVAASGRAVLVASGSNDSLNAAACTGTTTFVLSPNTGAVVTVGQGSNYVVASSSNATINSGAGSTTIFGGAGALDINLVEPEYVLGTTVILDYNSINDHLAFSPTDMVTSTQTSFGLQLTSSHESVLLYHYFGPVDVGH